MDGKIDLIDDIWLQIFSEELKLGLARVKLAQVCKRWRDLILNPNQWRTFEFKLRFFGHGKNQEKLNHAKQVVPFIAKYCRALVDLNLSIDSNVSNELLDIVLGIKTLKRISIEFEHSGSVVNPSIYTSTKAPACQDLVLLHIRDDLQFSAQGFQSLLAGLPNLEELYLPQAILPDPTALFSLPKLQRLCLSEKFYNVRTFAQDLAKLMPQVRLIILQVGFGYSMLPVDPEEILSVNNALIVNHTFYTSRKVEVWQTMKEFLDPKIHSQILSELVQQRRTDIITYLVKELKFDINVDATVRFEYRPAIGIPAVTNFLMPLEVALGAAVGSSDVVTMIGDLLALGASVKKLKPRRWEKLPEEAMLLMLNYGWDMSQVVDGYPLFFDLMTEFTEMNDVLAEVIKRYDVTQPYNGITLLDHAVINKRQYAFRPLLDAGLRWTPATVKRLFQRNVNYFKRMVRERGFDFNLLDYETLFAGLQADTFPDFKEHLTQLTDIKDSNGWTPMHHAVLCSNNQWPHQANEHRGDHSRGLHESWILAGPQSRLLVEHQKSSAFVKRSHFDEINEGAHAPRANNANFSFGGSNNAPTPFPLGPQNSMFGISTGTNNLNTNGNVGTTFMFGNNTGPNGYNTPNFNSGATFGTYGSPTNSVADAPLLTDILELLANCDINAKSDKGRTPLLCLTMSSECKANKIKVLLNRGAHANAADNNGWTPLHAALYSGSWRAASELIAHGADVNAQDRLGITPLMALLIGFGHNPQLSFKDIEVEWTKLMSLDVNVNLVDKTFNRSLMHYAACVGSPGMLQLIRNKNPDLVNAVDYNGYTPLHYALMFCNATNVVLSLIEQADVNKQTSCEKYTPLMLAAVMFNKMVPKHLATSSSLLRSLSQISRINQQVYFVSPPWVTDNELPTEKFPGKVAAWAYAEQDLATILEALIAKSDLSVRDRQGNTVLIHLCNLVSMDETRITTLTVRLLQLLKGKNFAPIWSVKNFYGTSPLVGLLNKHYTSMHETIFNGLVDVVKANNLDLFEPLPDGRPLIHHVTTSVQPELRARLLNFIVLENCSVKYGLQIGAEMFFITMLKELGPSSQLVADVLQGQPQLINERDKNGNTPLMVVVEQLLAQWDVIGHLLNRIEVFNVLLAAPGVAVNAQNNMGDTPLHLACRYFHLGAVDVISAKLDEMAFINAMPFSWIAFKLLAAGAHVDILNKQQEKPLDYCLLLENFFNDYNTVVNTYYTDFKKQIAENEAVASK